MIWQNLSELAQAHANLKSRSQSRPNSQSNSKSKEADTMPVERWGHASVAAHNKMFIIGGYQGNNINNQPQHFPNFQPPNSLSELVVPSLPITTTQSLTNPLAASNHAQT
jgi:hypothetical protein